MTGDNACQFVQNPGSGIRVNHQSQLVSRHFDIISYVTTRSYVTSRRQLLRAAAAAAPLTFVSRLLAKNRIDRSRISAITDEIGMTTTESVDFAKTYGLKWVEVREIREKKKEVGLAPEADVKELAAALAGAGLKISFMNTSLLKYTWPGMEAARPPRNDTPEKKEKRLVSEKERFDRRMEDLGKALTAAKILGCDKVRVFSGSRTADPQSTYPRVIEVLSPMVEEAAKHKIHLLVENEASQNVATSAELGMLVPMLKSPWFGYNWDPNNAHSAKEIPFPDGYKKLPIDRMLNSQVKARDLLPDFPADNLPWHDIMEAMEKDGYKGHIGLETHIFDGTLIPKANLSMKEIFRIVDSL
jgi:sugar phosphate isomerase/epimerase